MWTSLALILQILLASRVSYYSQDRFFECTLQDASTFTTSNYTGTSPNCYEKFTVWGLVSSWTGTLDDEALSQVRDPSGNDLDDFGTDVFGWHYTTIQNANKYYFDINTDDDDIKSVGDDVASFTFPFKTGWSFPRSGSNTKTWSYYCPETCGVDGVPDGVDLSVEEWCQFLLPIFTLIVYYVLQKGFGDPEFRLSQEFKDHVIDMFVGPATELKETATDWIEYFKWLYEGIKTFGASCKKPDHEEKIEDKGDGNAAEEKEDDEPTPSAFEHLHERYRLETWLCGSTCRHPIELFFGFIVVLAVLGVPIYCYGFFRGFIDAPDRMYDWRNLSTARFITIQLLILFGGIAFMVILNIAQILVQVTCGAILHRLCHPEERPPDEELQFKYKKIDTDESPATADPIDDVGTIDEIEFVSLAGLPDPAKHDQDSFAAAKAPDDKLVSRDDDNVTCEEAAL